MRAAEVTGGQTEGVPLRFSGIVRAAQRATLTFQVSGTLRRTQAVELGQTVKAGDVLARVYNPCTGTGAGFCSRARLDELRTQYDQAKREWERSSRLHERGVVSEQDPGAAGCPAGHPESQHGNGAEHPWRRPPGYCEESKLRAPFAGRVEALLVERDEFVAAGQPVMRLSSPEGREVEVRVPAYLLNHVSTVASAAGLVGAGPQPPAPVTGSIVEIAQPGGVRGELHPVLVSLPADTLEPGEPVEVGITPVRESVATTVPLLSVIEMPTEAPACSGFPMAVARRVPVTVERVIGERVVVDAGDLSAR